MYENYLIKNLHMFIMYLRKNNNFRSLCLVYLLFQFQEKVCGPDSKKWNNPDTKYI